MDVRFGQTSTDYAKHRQGFPPEFFQRMNELGVAPQGARILDVGAGTGALSLPLAKSGALVTALDPSPEQLRALGSLAQEQGLEVSTVCAAAEATGLCAGAFEWVCAAQCWHWFDSARAMKESRRVLAPGGRLLICGNDWLPEEGSVPAASEELIESHNPSWDRGGGDGFHPEWKRDLREGGFRIIEEGDHRFYADYTHDAWRGRIRASAGVSASLAPDAVDAFDKAHAELLSQRFPDEPLRVPHRYAYCIATYDH